MAGVVQHRNRTNRQNRVPQVQRKGQRQHQQVMKVLLQNHIKLQAKEQEIVCYPHFSHRGQRIFPNIHAIKPTILRIITIPLITVGAMDPIELAASLLVIQSHPDLVILEKGQTAQMAPEILGMDHHEIRTISISISAIECFWGPSFQTMRLSSQESE